MAYTSSTFRRFACGAAALLAVSLAARDSLAADSHLLYFEGQGIAAYSSQAAEVTAYSMAPDAEMQRPSLGFDYLHRFSGEQGDIGSSGIQFRLAYKRTDPELVKRIEPQLYNAWLKVKTPWTDLWIGHNRPALGLGSYFDSHPLILRTLPIQGFGYDRDWGVGTYRDFSWGNLQLSATTGSGMPVLFKGNYLLAARVAYGVLNEENFTVGFSGGYGETLDTMGYKLRESEPAALRLAGADFALLRDSFEHRFDLFAGEWLGKSTVAAMYRLGYVFDAEGRLKVEAQPTWWRTDGENWLMSLCVTGLLTSDLTSRAMYEYDRDNRDHRFVAQLYYYKPI